MSRHHYFALLLVLGSWGFPLEASHPCRRGMGLFVQNYKLLRFVHEAAKSDEVTQPSPIGIRRLVPLSTNGTYFLSDQIGGRHLLVEGPQSVQNFVFSRRGQTLFSQKTDPSAAAPRYRGKPLVEPNYDGGYSPEMDRLGAFLIDAQSDLNQRFQGRAARQELQELIAATPPKILEEGAFFGFGRITGYPFGGRGYLQQIGRGKNAQFHVRVLTPKSEVTLTDSRGRRETIDTDKWRLLTDDAGTLHQTPSRADYEDASAFALRAEKKEKQKAFRHYVSKLALMSLYYPYTIPFALPYRFSQSFLRGQNRWRALFPSLLKGAIHDLPAITLHGLLLAGGFQALSSLPEEIEQSFAPMIDGFSFLEETAAEFGVDNSEEPLVVIEAFPKGDSLYGSAEALFILRGLANQKNAFFIRGKDYADVRQKLLALRAKLGKPIPRGELYAHGSKDKVFRGIQIGTDLVGLDTSQLESEFEKARAVAALQQSRGVPLSSELARLSRFRLVDLDKLPQIEGVFDDHSRFRFLSCDVAEGCEGENYVGGLAGKFSEKNSVAFASTVPVGLKPHPNLWIAIQQHRERVAKLKEEQLRKRSVYERVRQGFVAEVKAPFVIAQSLWNFATHEPDIKRVVVPSH